MRLKTIEEYAAERPGTLVMTAIAVGGIGLIAFYEVLVLIPMPWWLYAAFFSAWVLLAILVRALLPGPVVDCRRSVRWVVVGVLVVGAALAALYWTPWSSRKPFLRSFEQIRPGMSKGQVRAVMEGYEGSGGEDALYFRHSREARFNSDYGVVYLKNDLVTATEFLPD